jgi:hypothetical protein
MLEKHIVLVSCSTNSTEDSAAHEMICVRTKAIDDLPYVNSRLYLIKRFCFSLRRGHPKC